MKRQHIAIQAGKLSVTTPNLPEKHNSSQQKIVYESKSSEILG